MPAMGSYKDPLVEKILLDISNVFSKDVTLCEFDIIPVETNYSNKSPVLHMEHSLALEGWCMKSLYSYCYSVLMEQYISGKGPARNKINITNWEEADRLLKGALLINPDVTVFWNKRREMYRRKFLKFCDEMTFSRTVLSRKSKCNEVFAYRKWLLLDYWETTAGVHLTHLANTASPELALSLSCAQKSSNNYHAWTHRRWLMCQFEVLAPSSLFHYWTAGELRFSDTWITSNVSDHSGLHYRQFIIDTTLRLDDTFTYLENELKKFKTAVDNIMLNINETSDTTDDKSEKEIVNDILGTILEDNVDSKMYIKVYRKLGLLIYDLAFNKRLSEFFSSHEALWSHRRYTITKLLNVICNYFGGGDFKSEVALNLDSLCDGSSNITNCAEGIIEAGSAGLSQKEAKILRHQHHSVLNSSLYRALVVNENKFIEQRSKCGDVFSIKYLKWLRHIMGFSI